MCFADITNQGRSRQLKNCLYTNQGNNFGVVFFVFVQMGFHVCFWLKNESKHEKLPYLKNPQKAKTLAHKSSV